MRVAITIAILMTTLLGLPAAVGQEAPRLSQAVQATTPEQAAVEQAIIRQLREADPRLQAFYRTLDHRPAWRNSETVAGFTATLRTLEGDGLSPGDYAPEVLVNAHRQLGEMPEAQARFDLRATRVLFTVLEHLQRGRVDPGELGLDVLDESDALDPARIARAVEAGRFKSLFNETRPAMDAYDQLRTGLANYRDIARNGGWSKLPERREALHPGDVHDDTALLRKRLAPVSERSVSAADPDIFPEAQLVAPDPRRYDENLVEAVKAFQRRHLLEVDGVVGPKTREALNVPVARRIDQIRLNLERARWLLQGLPQSFVLVDIAGYRLDYRRPNGEIWRSRIVVGRPKRPTPTLRSGITHFTINPSWTIPPTIRREDVLPEVRRNLDYLEEHDIQVLSPSGERLDPKAIDWSQPGNVLLRQRPGPKNPLGRVVMRFPNDYLVYLHDTPARHLFTQQRRAFSSGCVRVEKAMEFAQLLFDDTGSDRAIESLIGSGDTFNVSLASEVPVILHYRTVHPDDTGKLTFRPDIYGRDDALIAALDRPLVL